MKKNTTAEVLDQASTEAKNALDAIVAEGARKLLQHAIELKAPEYVERNAGEFEAEGVDVRRRETDG